MFALIHKNGKIKILKWKRYKNGNKKIFGFNSY